VELHATPVYLMLDGNNVVSLQGKNIPHPNAFYSEVNAAGSSATGVFLDEARTPVRIEARGLDAELGHFTFVVHFMGISLPAKSRLPIVKALAEKMTIKRAFACGNVVRKALTGDAHTGRKVRVARPHAQVAVSAILPRPAQGKPSLPPASSPWKRTSAAPPASGAPTAPATALRMPTPPEDTREGILGRLYRSEQRGEVLEAQMQTLSVAVDKVTSSLEEIMRFLQAVAPAPLSGASPSSAVPAGGGQ
jgi:hypothetical protein